MPSFQFQKRIIFLKRIHMVISKKFIAERVLVVILLHNTKKKNYALRSTPEHKAGIKTSHMLHVITVGWTNTAQWHIYTGFLQNLLWQDLSLCIHCHWDWRTQGRYCPHSADFKSSNQQWVHCSSCARNLYEHWQLMLLDHPVFIIINMILSIALIWAVVVGFCCLLWLAVGIRHRWDWCGHRIS